MRTSVARNQVVILVGNADDDLSRQIREASFTVADVLTERDQAK